MPRKRVYPEAICYGVCLSKAHLALLATANDERQAIALAVLAVENAPLVLALPRVADGIEVQDQLLRCAL